MKLLWILLAFQWAQTHPAVTKINGDLVSFMKVDIYQKEGVSSGQFIDVTERGQEKRMEISKLKRINLKEATEKNKGVKTWLVILVFEDNEKIEVEMDLIEVVGTMQDGSEETISANAIDKITF